MRDLCLLKAKEENFLEIVRIKAFGHQLTWADSALPSSSSPLTTIRRLAVYYLDDHDANFIESENVIPLSGHEMKNHNHIRSCQFYSFGHELESSGWQKLKLLLKGLTLLTVLDLERIKIPGGGNIIPGGGKKFPRAIGNLIYLKYLSIRDSDIKSLPSSIGNLGFLQTLDLRISWGDILRMPNVLWRLKQLRHLYLPYFIELSCIGKLRLDGLSKLETLENFDASECDVRCLSKLTNLRKFSGRVTPKDLVVILKSPIFNDSNRLLQYSSFRILRGDFRTEEEQSLLRQLLGCHHLRKLDLQGSLNPVKKLADQFPPNLTTLKLVHSKLVEDPMPTLEKLPNLRSLSLDWDSYIGKEMVCSSGPSSISGGGGGGGYGGFDGGGFPKLISLDVSSLHNLEEWRVEQGAMPCLFRLLIFECEKLKEIPDGLRFITTLRELEIVSSVSEALLDRVREGGEDFYKVQHVPSITLQCLHLTKN
ncbi:putative disease resistance protein [Camellia lanceoleosa]|uniref:Disease resistance protein n=1 Tax=Camellia lanceoleosa TaxID=1840588 RepID=A0ACC0IRQ4_9ERIC|nr:putative disease resistance protein [Camellia lanceoleosa]